MDWLLRELHQDTSTGTREDLLGQTELNWDMLKVSLVVPFLRIVVILWLIMSLMLSFEGAYTGIVTIFLRLRGRKSEQRYKWEPIRDDEELGSSAYPMVLLQIPMYNEKEVCQLSIAAACGLSWPSDRLVIQVLDDSTDPAIRDKVRVECQRWTNKGVNIKHEVRDNRNGYKAGALKAGMSHSYAKQCDYVAIFDADFQPESDFLWRTVPFLVHNPELALVQARWDFVNADDCLMTRMQKMSLDYHFKVEQEVGSYMFDFFGFNGSAGVWRNAAIDDAGGWKDRTTVEDADLAVRAILQGWKFLYLGSVEVKSELPSTFKAYRYQQHRWSCGGANLFRKILKEIIRNEKVSLWKKGYVIYSFFLVRKLIAPFLPFVYICIVLPGTVLIPEVEVPKLGAVSVVFIITLLNVVGTPRSLPLLVFWILFENVMSLHRTKAAIIGLVEARRVNEWIVTKKLGDAPKTKTTIRAPAQRPQFRIPERLQLLELGTGLYLFLCGCCHIAFGGRSNFVVLLFFQAIAFFFVGFGCLGTFIQSSYAAEHFQ